MTGTMLSVRSRLVSHRILGSFGNKILHFVPYHHLRIRTTCTCRQEIGIVGVCRRTDTGPDTDTDLKTVARLHRCPVERTVDHMAGAHNTICIAGA